MKHARLLGAVLAALSLSTLASESSLHAQEQELPRIGEARLRVFATAYLAMATASEEFQGEMGRSHEAQERDRLRQRLRDRLTAILGAREMTQEEYEHITLLVSIDEEQLELFEEILEELTGNS